MSVVFFDNVLFWKRPHLRNVFFVHVPICVSTFHCCINVVNFSVVFFNNVLIWKRPHLRNDPYVYVSLCVASFQCCHLLYSETPSSTTFLLLCLSEKDSMAVEGKIVSYCELPLPKGPYNIKIMCNFPENSEEVPELRAGKVEKW